MVVRQNNKVHCSVNSLPNISININCSPSALGFPSLWLWETNIVLHFGYMARWRRRVDKGALRHAYWSLELTVHETWIQQIFINMIVVMDDESVASTPKTLSLLPCTLHTMYRQCTQTDCTSFYFSSFFCVEFSLAASALHASVSFRFMLNIELNDAHEHICIAPYE